MYFHSIRQHLAKCWLGASLLASLVCSVSAAAAASSNRMAELRGSPVPYSSPLPTATGGLGAI